MSLLGGFISIKLLRKQENREVNYEGTLSVIPVDVFACLCASF